MSFFVVDARMRSFSALVRDVVEGVMTELRRVKLASKGALSLSELRMKSSVYGSVFGTSFVGTPSGFPRYRAFSGHSALGLLCR